MSKNKIFEYIEKIDTDKLKELLDHKVNFNATNIDGDVPLIAAVRINNIEAVKILIHNGAKVSVVDPWDDTPLEIAKKLGFTDIYNLIANTSNIIIAQPSDNTKSLTMSANSNINDNANCAHEDNYINGLTDNEEDKSISLAVNNIDLEYNYSSKLNIRHETNNIASLYRRNQLSTNSYVDPVELEIFDNKRRKYSFTEKKRIRGAMRKPRKFLNFV